MVDVFFSWTQIFYFKKGCEKCQVGSVSKQRSNLFQKISDTSRENQIWKDWNTTEISWTKLCYGPRTAMTSIFEGQPLKTRPFPSKTRVIWVLGRYTKHSPSWNTTWLISPVTTTTWLGASAPGFPAAKPQNKFAAQSDILCEPPEEKKGTPAGSLWTNQYNSMS